MPASRDQSGSTPPDGRRQSRTLGLVTSILSSVFGALYLLGIVGNLATTGGANPHSELLQVVSSFIAIAWEVALVVLFVTLRGHVRPSRAIFAELARVFMVLTCATSSINWFVRLTLIPRLSPGADAAILALIDPYSHTSLMFALEHLGWGVFIGLAALFAAFAVEGSGLDLGVRWLLVGAGILSLLHVVGLVFPQPVLYFLGYPAAGVFLPAATMLLAVRYRREPAGA